MPNYKRFDGNALLKGLVPVTSKTKRGKPHEPVSPPAVITSPRGSTTKARGSNQSGSAVKITDAVSSNRMLAARKLLVTRPELLAMLDFFPIYNGSGKKSKAGDLFDLRVSLRASSLDSVEESLEQVQADEAFAEPLALATGQYESTLASIFAEVSFLQLVFLLRKYAERSTNWTDFTDSWTPPADYHTDWIGDTFEDYMKTVMMFDPPDDFSGEGAFLYDEETAAYTDAIQYYDMGILSLLQLILDLSFSTAIAIPKIVWEDEESSARVITDPYVSWGYSTKDDLADDVEATASWIAKTLMASRVFAKIAADEIDDLDEEMVTALKTAMGEDFFSATTDPEKASLQFRGFFGVDPFSTVRRILGRYRKRTTRAYYVNQLLSKNRQGAISKLLDYQTRIIYVHDYNIKLKKSNGNYRTYGNIISEVDKAFESEVPLDFTSYKTAVEGLKELGDAAIVWKKLYRLLDYKNLEDDEIPAGIPVLSEEHPLSPASIYLKALQIFQNRCVSKLYSALRLGEVATGEAKDGDTEAINYVKIMAYILWKEMPDRGRKWMGAVWEDYVDGYLTAQTVPQEVENDDGDMEFEDPVWVSPVTGATLDAFAKGTKLGSYMRRPWKTLQDGSFTEFNSTMNVSSDVTLISDAGSDYGVANIDDACDSIEDKYVQIPPGDTRQCTFLYAERERSDGTTSTTWCYIKLIAAEVIDCQMELLRSILDDIEEVEPVADDDPFWPNVEDTNTPYGTSRMNFTDDMYSGVDTEYWVPTLSKYVETFCRTGDFNTYAAGRDPASMLKYLSDMWHGILLDFFAEDCCDLRINYDLKRYTVSSSDTFNYESWLLCVIATSGQFSAKSTNFYSNLPSAVDTLLAASPEDVIEDNWDIEAPSISAGDATASGVDDSDGLKDRWTAWANKCFNHTRDLMQTDIGVGVGFDLLEKYIDRVNEYSSAALNTVGQGDEPNPDNPIVAFVTGLLETGIPGQDILQNVNSQQLSLKEVSLARQQGDADQGYVPVADLISENEIKAIKMLFSNESLVGSEGQNIRSFVIGLPAGIFEENDIMQFSIISNLADIEYSDLIFRSKAFNFDKDLYVLPEDFDSITSWGSISNFRDLVETIQFTRIRYDIVENDAGTDLEVVATNEKENATDEDFDIYANHLISTLLESYYKIMVGIELSEDTFVSTDQPLGLAIGDYAADLGGAMSSLYSSLDSESSSLSGLFDVSDKIVADYDSMLSSFSSEVAAGEFSELDAAMLSKFKDTMSSRLFTAEEMREKVLSAKVFDRLFFFLLDPDEFFVESSSSRNGTDPYTPATLITKYLSAGVLEGNESYPKLAPRSKSEGNMNFCKFYFSLGEKSDGEGGPDAASTSALDPDLEQIDY